MSLHLDKIEAAARTARLASLWVRSIWVAALYDPEDVVATICWSAPCATSDPAVGPDGVSRTDWRRPPDASILIGRGRAADVEAQVLACAWALGAWDVRRTEYAPLDRPAEWQEPRYGLAQRFGVGGYAVDGAPLVAGDRSPEAARRAASDGHVGWHFVPLALASPWMQQRWSGKDRTLDPQTCTRGARAITPRVLVGPPGGHDHLYLLGRGNHGNRSRAQGRRAQ